MRNLKFLIEKEFKQVWRNPLILYMITLFPALVLLAFPWAINYEIKNIKIDIVDLNKTTLSQRLINKIASSKYFILNKTPLNYNDALTNMECGKTDMILEIPSTFEVDLMREQRADIGLAINSLNGTMGVLGSNYINNIVLDYSTELRSELLPKLLPHSAAKLSNNPKVNIAPLLKFNPKLDYKIFIIPSFFVLLLTIICGLLPALNIVLEKENGTIHQINVTPVSKFGFILAKLIPFWVIGLIVIIISAAIAYLMYGLLPAAGFFPVFLIGSIYIFSISGMGIIISNHSNNLQQASFLVMFFILIIVLLSGMFTPISSMPHWAQMIALINPYTYLTKSLRMLYLHGSTLSGISGDILMLGIFALILNLWAVLSYKKRG